MRYGGRNQSGNEFITAQNYLMTGDLALHLFFQDDFPASKALFFRSRPKP